MKSRVNSVSRSIGILFACLFVLAISQFASANLTRGQGEPTLTPFVVPFGPVTSGTLPPNTPSSDGATSAPALPTPTFAHDFTPTPQLPTLVTEQMGIQIYAFLETPAWWAMVDRSQFMGFGWIKAQISWKEMEPEKGAYTQTFKTVGENLIYAAQRHFKILISVVNAPDWARPAEARGQNDGPPANPQDYADFIGHFLDTYGVGYFSAVEVWNEPNLTREWTGAARTAEAYKKVFDAAYQAIRARSADLIVLTAGLAPAGDTPGGSVNDRTWLQDLYKTGLPITDPNFAISVHPYGWSNPPDAHCCANPSGGWDDQRFFFFLDNIADYRQIMVANGHSAGKLWATEFGWATFQGLRYKDHVNGPPAIAPAEPALGWMNRINEQQQAQYIVRAFELAQNGDLASFMGPIFLWNLNFASLSGYVKENAPSLPEAGFSILNSDWAQRPIYDMLQYAPRRK